LFTAKEFLQFELKTRRKPIIKTQKPKSEIQIEIQKPYSKTQSAIAYLHSCISSSSTSTPSSGLPCGASSCPCRRLVFLTFFLLSPFFFRFPGKLGARVLI